MSPPGRIDAALRLAKAGDAWLFLVRDFCSAVIYIASLCGDTGRLARPEHARRFRQSYPRPLD